MSAPQVTGLYRYPVKSMMGEVLNSADLGERGIPGDRAWAIRDEERGGIRGGKRFPTLMQARARYLKDPPADGSASAEVEFPDGRTLAIDSPEAAEAIGALVGNPVSVWPLLPAENEEHYRRGAPLDDDMETELRRVFGRTPDEPLPDLSAFPDILMTFESPPGTYFDAFPLLLMTRNSLDHLDTTGDQSFDVRRFRPNILLDVPGDNPFPENDWAGREMRIGSALLKLEMICPRCSMTTRGFDDLPEDPTIMRSLVRNAEGNLGIYASVIEPGRISHGDAATFVDSR